jgi:predicted nuclease of predicted toxin-antitoxin system
MKFLLDAQRPRRLARELAASGHDAIHTLDLPAGNRTQDRDLVELAIRENRILVTKDNDFVVSFHLRRLPPKLLLVSTGNVSNVDLVKLFALNLNAVENAFAQNSFVELSASALTIHC